MWNYLDLTRKPSESFLDYADRLITERDNKILDIDNAEIYELLFNEQVSSDHARKCLYGIRKTLEQYKLEPKSVQVDEENELEEELKKKSSVEICNDGSYKSEKLLRMSEEESKDVKYLLKAHGFDSKCWELVSARNNIWNVYSKIDKVQTLYSSKIVVKPKATIFDEEWIERTISNINFKADFKSYTYEFLDKAKTVEINFADVHIGKYIDAIITGGNYNADIAIEIFKKAIEESIFRLQPYFIKQFIFIVGQDYINFDHFEGSTTKGTRQDMNEFFEIVYEKAYECLIWTIEKLRVIAPVKVVYVKGNHDALTTYTMCSGLHKLYSFNNVKDVDIDFSTKQRKYIEIGDTVLGLGHGEKEKNRITNCMQTDVPELWNKKYRYFHLSHFHSEKVKETGGVLYRWLGSLSENCKWTWENGFVGAQKKGHVFIYEDVGGLYGEFYIST